MTSSVSPVRDPEAVGGQMAAVVGKRELIRVFSSLPGLLGGKEARLFCVSLILALLSAGDW